MNLEQMSCCGMFELQGLSENIWDESDEIETPARTHWDEPVYKRISKEQAIRKCRLAIADELSGIPPRGRLVLATTIRRMPIEVAALKALKFKVVRTFRNGNSGNMVTVWQKLVRR